MITAIRDSATGWYKKGDTAQFIREVGVPQVDLIVIRKKGEKKTTIVIAANWGWI